MPTRWTVLLGDGMESPLPTALCSMWTILAYLYSVHAGGGGLRWQDDGAYRPGTAGGRNCSWTGPQRAGDLLARASASVLFWCFRIATLALHELSPVVGAKCCVLRFYHEGRAPITSPSHGPILEFSFHTGLFGAGPPPSTPRWQGWGGGSCTTPADGDICYACQRDTGLWRIQRRLRGAGGAGRSQAHNQPGTLNPKGTRAPSTCKLLRSALSGSLCTS